jgi:hypothetical protein
MPALWADAVACRPGPGFVPTSATTALTCTAAATLSTPLAPTISPASHKNLFIHALFLIREAAQVIPDATSRVLLLKFINVLVYIFQLVFQPIRFSFEG